MSERAGSFTRRALLGTVSAAGLTSLAGCSVVGGSSPTRLRMGTVQPPVTLDPITAKYLGSTQVFEKLFDGLYTYGEGTDLHPRIAAGRPTDESGESVLVDLSEAATFHDGESVTAEDVKYSLEAPVAEDAAAKAAVSGIETVEAVDERSVRLHLDWPYPALDRALTQPIVPKSVREADREGFATEPVGSGPYELASFSEERAVRLTRWPDYSTGPVPEIEEVSVVYIESPITGMMSLRTGRTDVVEPVSPQLEDRMRDVSNATVTSRACYRSYYFGFNLNEGPTTDPRVREAVARCIDVDDAVEQFVAPFGRRQYGPVPPTVAEDWAFPREEWRSLTARKNVERASELLDAADAGGGQFVILTSLAPKWRELGQQLARGLRDAGQSTLVDSVSWKTYLDRYVSGSESDYSVFLGEVAGTPDPDSFLYPTFHENMEGVTNGIFYNDESVMNALLEARRTTDRSARRERYVGATRRLLEERVFVPVCSVDCSFAHDPGVEGFRVHPIARLNPRVVSPDGVMTVGGGS